jgi:hypothetical protein
MWRLEDDGSFELDMSSLGLSAFNSGVEIWMARTSYTTTAGVGGEHLVHTGLHNTSVWFMEQYYNADRDFIAGTDRCFDIDGELPIEPGSYWGTLEGATNDVDPGDDGCTGRAASSEDNIHKVILEPGQRLNASARAPGGDLALYLVSDCNDESTCSQASDGIVFPEDGFETIEYANTGVITEVLYLVIDGPGIPMGPYFLDVDIEDAGVITPFPDSCAEAEFGASVAPGVYVTSLEGYADDLNLGPAGCAGVDSAGGDAILKVTLPSGQRLKAETSGTHAVYVMLDCADPRTCLDGAVEEPLRLLNTTGADLEAFVVIDDLTGRPPTSITDVAINLEPPTLWPDTCLEAISAAPLTTGVYDVWNDTSTYSDDLDVSIPGPSCTGYNSAGNDVIVPVRLEAGETLNALYTALDSDTVLYLLSSCRDSTTTLACVDSTLVSEPEVLNFVNTTGAPLDAYLVLDTYFEDGFAPPSTILEARVEIY